jgi:hypothetical protein
VGSGWAVFGGVLVAAAGSQLHDSLDTNVQRFQLLPYDVLRHTPTQVLHQKPHAAILSTPALLIVLTVILPTTVTSSAHPPTKEQVVRWYQDIKTLRFRALMCIYSTKQQYSNNALFQHTLSD